MSANRYLSWFYILILLVGKIFIDIHYRLAYIDQQSSVAFGFIILLLASFAVLKANIKTDFLMSYIGLSGGLLIEFYGTQTEMWKYYTADRPPMWIMPSWALASLAIDHFYVYLDQWFSGLIRKNITEKQISIFCRSVMLLFYLWMIAFVWPFIDMLATKLILIAVLYFVLRQKDPRSTTLVFTAGLVIGFFIEYVGTSTHCWTYYTKQTPPPFIVAAHGMVAVMFWRVRIFCEKLIRAYGIFLRTNLP